MEFTAIAKIFTCVWLQGGKSIGLDLHWFENAGFLGLNARKWLEIDCEQLAEIALDARYHGA